METVSQSTSSWWRCSAYEIVDRSIIPRRRARVEEYDPWEGFDTASISATSSAVPYLSALALLDALKRQQASSELSSGRLNPVSERLITDWCAQHGLLGLLHRSALVVWRQPAPSRRVASWVPDEVAWRTGGTWKRLALGVDRPASAPPSRHVVRPQTLMEGTIGGPLKPLDPSGLRSLFFPRLPEKRPVPVPGAEGFWREYAEPVTWFIESIEILTTAIATPTDREMTSEESRTADEALGALLAPVSPIGLRRRDGVLRVDWSSPSLLSTFATMALLAHHEDAPPAKCEKRDCGEWFSRKPISKRYCSPGCQNTEEKRRYRSDAATKARRKKRAAEARRKQRIG